jgi:Imm-5 like putative immunity protein
MILPKVRDPRFIAMRRGGSLTDDEHHLLATWAADCAQHVLHLFEQARPDDDRPGRAIDLARAWARGEVTWWQARSSGGHANAAARDRAGRLGMRRTLPARPLASVTSPPTSSAPPRTRSWRAAA